MEESERRKKDRERQREFRSRKEAEKKRELEKKKSEAESEQKGEAVLHKREQEKEFSNFKAGFLSVNSEVKGDNVNSVDVFFYSNVTDITNRLAHLFIMVLKIARP